MSHLRSATAQRPRAARAPVAAGLTGEDVATLVRSVPVSLREPFPPQVNEIAPDAWARIVSRKGAWCPTETVDGVRFTAWSTGEGHARLAVADPSAAGGNVLGLIARMRVSRLLLPYEFVHGVVVGPGVGSNPLHLGELRVLVHTFGEFDQARGAASGSRGVRVPRCLWPSWARSLAVPVFDFPLPDAPSQAQAQVRGLGSLVAPGALAAGVTWTRHDGIAVPEVGGRHVFTVTNHAVNPMR